VAYDNIAAGSATGAERPVAGSTTSRVEIHGGGYMTSTSTGDTEHSNVEAGSSVTDQVSPGKVPENVLAQGTGPTDENIG
jgi:hypothetical protein